MKLLPACTEACLCFRQAGRGSHQSLCRAFSTDLSAFSAMCLHALTEVPVTDLGQQLSVPGLMWLSRKRWSVSCRATERFSPTPTRHSAMSDFGQAHCAIFASSARLAVERHKVRRHGPAWARLYKGAAPRTSPPPHNTPHPPTISRNSNNHLQPSHIFIMACPCPTGNTTPCNCENCTCTAAECSCANW